MATLLSNGSTVLMNKAPVPRCASGGAGSTIFSSGKRGGSSRAGRWKASRLTLLLLRSKVPSAGTRDPDLGHRQLGPGIGRRPAVDQLDREAALVDRKGARGLPRALVL